MKMKQTHHSSTIASLLALMACVAGVTSAFAFDSSATTASSVPLRGEIAMQYNQPNGTAVNVGGSTEMCVPSGSVDGMQTGNQANGSLHCHSLLKQPVQLSVQLNEEKLDLPITTVGNKPLNLKGIVDTGSGGLTLNAFQIFPASMVTRKGFKFNGSNQIVYNGITVTRLVATRDYGGETADKTSRTGNLGFAHVTFGERGEVKTALIPILFVYTSTKEPSATSSDLDNTIGINGEMDPIGQQVSLDGDPIDDGSDASATVYPECTTQSTTKCSLISPLRALSYSNDLQAGYILNSFPLVEGQKGRYLTVGLDQHDTEGFASAQLRCITSSFDVQACNQEVPNVNVVTSAGLNSTWYAIFDSGRPTVGITVPVDNSNPPAPAPLPAGQAVTVTPPNQGGYTYTFTTGTGLTATTLTSVNPDADGADETYSNMGLEFFGTNSLMLDYDKGIEGWKRADSSN